MFLIIVPVRNLVCLTSKWKPSPWVVDTLEVKKVEILHVQWSMVYLDDTKSRVNEPIYNRYVLDVDVVVRQ